MKSETISFPREDVVRLLERVKADVLPALRGLPVGACDSLHMMLLDLLLGIMRGVDRSDAITDVCAGIPVPLKRFRGRYLFSDLSRDDLFFPLGEQYEAKAYRLVVVDGAYVAFDMVEDCTIAMSGRMDVVYLGRWQEL
jgi:hypothetical protein